MISNIKSLDREALKIESNTDFLSYNPDDKSSSENVNNIVEIIFCGDHNWSTKLASHLLSMQLPFNKIKLGDLYQLDEIHASEIIPFISKNIHSTTLIIGQRQKAIKNAFDAFQFLEKPFNVSLCQKEIGHINGMDELMLDLRAPWLQHLSVIGSQAQYTNPTFLAANQQSYFSSYRLGEVRKNIGMCEPEIRMSDLLGIDMGVLKSSEVSSTTHVSSVGFTVEELCQLAHYGGRSEQNKVFTIFNCTETTAEIAIDVIGTLSWYFLYGLDMSGVNYPPKVNNMITYVVEGSIYSEPLIFYKDDLHQKWWLKSPYPKKKLAQLNPLIACDYHDYSTAVNEQMLTDRLEKALERHENSEDVLDPQVV